VRHANDAIAQGWDSLGVVRVHWLNIYSGRLPSAGLFGSGCDLDLGRLAACVEHLADRAGDRIGVEAGFGKLLAAAALIDP
jgi:hypothetical protein